MISGFASLLLGRLTPADLPHEPITIGAAVSMPLIVLAIVGLITYYHRWTWLWKEWLTTTDAKKIGVMYCLVALIMLVRGVFDAFMIRSQTVFTVGNHAGPFTADTFQQVFSSHGTIMIFFVAMGLMFGLINIALPMMLGARDVAFPTLNSMSFWLFVAGMILVNMSLVIGGFSNAGWLAYPPLSELQYNPGPGIDYWIWTLQIAGIGSTLSAVNFITTILKCRAKGMSLMKMPIFSWSVLVTMALIIAAFPVLTATLGMLALDRLAGTHFFTSGMGGNAMMYVNLIWAWGHPEVYILVMPSFGIYSEVVATYARKKIFGYKSMVLALIAIMFFSFVVWQHHFFTMGSGADVNTFFSITTMIIAIPTGVKIFNWLFTMYRGKIQFTAAMMWFMAFVITFTIGGVTGVLLSVPAIDFQVHNTLFLVAHFHNVIIGGVVFGLFAGINLWWPKVFGFRLHDRLGRWSAYMWTLGFWVTFMPLYIVGLMGAARRIDTYTDPAWQPFFIISAIGVMLIGVGILFMIIQIAYSVWKRDELRDTTGDPWDGRTLEWSTPSPAPYYSFAVLPEVTKQDDWWYQKQRGIKEPKYEDYKPILLPKNSSFGIIIGVTAGLFGFAMIWHIWWLGIAMVVAVVITALVRTLNDNSEYEVPADELYYADKAARKKAQA